ncbi:MAG: C25 family cysteine peptidase [Bacteroidales bacterium]|nr:C25 family cysteine peptidase [Bacteroidales bacterium]
MKNLSFFKILNLIFFFLTFSLSSNAQSIHINGPTPQNLTFISKSETVINFKSTVTEIAFTKELTSDGYYVRPTIEGYGSSNLIGSPSLPVCRKIIEIPLGAEVKINIISFKEQEYYLPDYGINFLLTPSQASVSKSDDREFIPFQKNNTIYTTDAFFELPLVSFDTLGIMRSSRIGRLNIAPVKYNPITKILKIVSEIEFEIEFLNADFASSENLKARTYSPFYQNAYANFINHDVFQTKSNLTQYPVKLVIVADPMFQSALQPFIQWKIKKGFTVIEAYTNNPAVGNTTTSIKSYLQSLYNAATPIDPAFSFVLFVGDVDQIPAFSGNNGSHITDLYYCEYTSDIFPEAYYGRFSANNLSELQPQIDKTLYYETNLMTSTAFLGEAILVAGEDATYAPIHGNGHLNYGTSQYFNASNNIAPHVFQYPASASSATQIKQDFSDGVGFVNYTAHCGSNGWGGPSFTTSDVPNLTNAGKYPVMIGNCCSSSEFGTYNCFAEAVLRAPEKGAIGYIGGSNSTYWDEDYWFGVGYKNIVLNPSYSASNLGAFDRVFHSHGEPFNEWFTTQAQINVAGNLAVTQSASSMINYYWEIYHLMGDPSLTPHLFDPPALSISYQNTHVIGSSTLNIQTEPYTYIGLSKNGVLHGAGLADSTGNLSLNYTPFASPGLADIVATKQNRKPHISTINIITPNGPYLIYTAHAVIDTSAGANSNSLADYGESVSLNVTVNNVGNQNASNLQLKLKTTDNNVVITDSTYNFAGLLSGQSETLNTAFSFNVNNLIPDQHTVIFSLEIRDVNDSIWLSQFFITLNSPRFSFVSKTIDDSNGNSNTILDPDETANLIINTKNNGGATANNAIATLTSLNADLVVNTSSVNIGQMSPGQVVAETFSVTASTSIALETEVKLLHTITAGLYIKTDTISIIVGEIPILNMKDTTLHTCLNYFYDAGGPNNDYNDAENYTITFLPAFPNSYIKVVFENFSIEENTYGGGCWDEMHVYNGSNTNAPSLGIFCGENIPGPFNASNNDGALTFKFISDNSVTQTGWKALVECISTINTDNIINELQYSIFPNPSSGLFNINIQSGQKEQIKINIYNIHGQQVYTHDFEGNLIQETINLNQLSAGIYFLKIHYNSGIVTDKITIY